MSDQERRDILARMRADRIARDGRPAYDPSMVIRDVVATQRLAGIDVDREWLDWWNHIVVGFAGCPCCVVDP